MLATTPETHSFLTQYNIIYHYLNLDIFSLLLHTQRPG